ncbi:MAG: TatD family hydrolase [Candidatus Paceibacterota bacterium]
MFEYFDIHSHLDVSDFDSDRENEIKKMKEQKIGTITIGVDFLSSQKAIELSEKNENIFATVGQHPEDINTDSVFDERIKTLVANERVVGIGECGLDYFYLSTNTESRLKNEYIKEVQKKIFEEQIKLSVEFQKPLMLHIRPSRGSQDAYVDTLNILEHYSKTYGKKLKGNSHFFVGELDTLRQFLDIGFTVSFTGVVTFSRDYDELVRYVPIDMIMSETDAPFVAPTPYRGTRNSPVYITEVVKKIAEIRGENLDKMKEVLINNTLKYFPGISVVAS